MITRGYASALLSWLLCGFVQTASAQTEVAQPAPVPAETSGDEAGWGDETDAVGFKTEPAPRVAPTEAPTDSPDRGVLDGSGSLRHRAALWTERLGSEPFAQSRQSVDLALRFKKPYSLFGNPLLLRLVGEGHVEYDFAYLHNPRRFDDATIETYRSQVIGREAFLALSYDALELTIGRQIVAWGQGEMLSPVDVINPRDMREPGLAELQDIRMALLASRLGVFVGDHRIELMLVHETFYGLRPAPFSDFSPLRAFLLSQSAVAMLLEDKQLRFRDEEDRFDDPAGQLYARWSYAGSGVDLAFYAAYTRDKQGVSVLPTAAELGADEIALLLEHPRYVMLGHAGAKPVGDFVLRWELGFDIDRPEIVTDSMSAIPVLDDVRRNRLGFMAGITYAGIEDTNIGLEYAQNYVFDNPERASNAMRTLLLPVEAPTFALRGRRTFFRERLELSLAGVLFGLDPYFGSFIRVGLDYELVEAVHAGLGYAMYLPSLTNFGPFAGMTDHDRAYATLRWDFTLE